MTYAQAREQITQWIVANANNEITADVLRPVLLAMLQSAEDTTGDPDDLATEDTTNLVVAINEVLDSISGIPNNVVKVYQGTNDPNSVPPAAYGGADFYIQRSLFDQVLTVWQYNAVTGLWVDAFAGGGTTGDFIPRSGTVDGEPVTGDIEIDNTQFDPIKIYRGNLAVVFDNDNQYTELRNLNNYVRTEGADVILSTSYGGNIGILSVNPSGVNLNISDPDSHGLSANQDFTDNIEDLDYVQKKYVDNAVSGITPDLSAYVKGDGTQATDIDLNAKSVSNINEISALFYKDSEGDVVIDDSGNWVGNRISTDRGGAGDVNGILKADGVGNVSAVESGTDIKTLGGQSLLGSGDVTEVQNSLVSSSTLAPSVDAVNGGLSAKEPTRTATTDGAFINGLTSKSTPVDADQLDLMDSAASNVSKKLSWANAKATLKTYFDTLYQITLTSANFGAFVNSFTTKTTPADSDQIGLMDSADSNNQKKLSWANLKAALKTYFDGLYGNKPSYMVLINPYTLTSTTSAQKMFNVGASGNGQFNAKANTTYHFLIEAGLNSLSATSGTFSFGIGGTANITSINAFCSAVKGNDTPATSQTTKINSTAATVITGSSASPTGRLLIEGYFRVTTAGTVQPQISLGTAAAAVIEANSAARFTEVGSNTFTASSDMD